MLFWLVLAFFSLLVDVTGQLSGATLKTLWDVEATRLNETARFDALDADLKKLSLASNSLKRVLCWAIQPDVQMLNH